MFRLPLKPIKKCHSQRSGFTHSWPDFLPSHCIARCGFSTTLKIYDDNWMMFDQTLVTSGAPAINGSATLASSTMVSPDAKSASGTVSMLYTIHPSRLSTFKLTAWASSQIKGGSMGVNCSGSRKKICLKRKPKSITKTEKTSLRREVISSPGKIKINVQVSWLRYWLPLRLPRPRPLIKFRTSKWMTMVHSRLLPTSFQVRMMLPSRR